MPYKPLQASRAFEKLLFLFFPAFFLIFHSSHQDLKAQPVTDHQSSQRSEMYNTLPGSDKKDTLINPGNPFDLIHRLNRAKAMEDATSPSDAIDQALRIFEEGDVISPEMKQP